MNTKRFEGRLFAEGGCLFMVVSTDEREETARVSCRLDDQSVVIDMPISEVSRRISSSTGIILDNLNGPESRRRISQQDDAWHFSTREGLMGPYESKEEAARELGRYVLSMQTKLPPKPRPAEGASIKRTPQRRSSDAMDGVQAVT